jgi:hypothetical protein
MMAVALVGAQQNLCLFVRRKIHGVGGAGTEHHGADARKEGARPFRAVNALERIAHANIVRVRPGLQLLQSGLRGTEMKHCFNFPELASTGKKRL